MRIALADKQPRVRAALRLLLEQQSDYVIVAEAAGLECLMEMINATHPQIILLDWQLVEADPQRWLGILKHCGWALSAVILSSYAEAREKALAAGADAFISKTDTPLQLLDTIRSVCPES